MEALHTPSPPLAAPPAAPSSDGTVVVDARIVRRVIRRHRRLRGIGAATPHTHCYAIAREALLAIVTDADLGCSGSLLPPTVVLVARPESDEGPERLISLWRQAFHGKIHAELEQRRSQGLLSAAAVRERIHRVGQAEFDEVRLVLKQDELLLAGNDDGEAYIEFAAYYLELRHFAPALLRRTFPTLWDAAGVERALALDLDDAALLAACRPDGALDPPRGDADPEPAAPPEPDARRPAPVPHAGRDGSPSALAAADRQRGRGNLARSAILRLSAQGEAGLDGAREDLSALAAQLHRAIGGVQPRADAHAEHEPGAGAAPWVEAMSDLAAVAAFESGAERGLEARLLHDLQMVCTDRQRGRKTIDVVGAALSMGKRSIVRDLPAVREVLVIKHLRGALAKAPRARLPAAQREALVHLTREALEQAEAGARARLGPTITGVLEAVGLQPRDAPERVARRKISDELLDHVLERGFLGFGQLRDALSTSNLKLPNVGGPDDLWQGDALLQADQRLSVALDGVYRRGEIYLRWLEKGSSLFFGTRAGRFLTLQVLLPCLLSFVALEGLQHLLAIPARVLFHYHRHIHLLSAPSFASLALVIYGCMHSEPFKAGLLRSIGLVGKIIRAVLLDAPRWVLHLPVVQAALGSRAAHLLGQLVIKPGAVALGGYAAASLVVTRARAAGVSLPSWADEAAALALFAALCLLFNTGAWTAMEEALFERAQRGWQHLQRRIIPGLVALIGGFFRALLEGLDRALYAVDQWLRFKEGDPVVSLWLKGALGVVWFFVTYLVRLYANVLIEPQINPIKHFPVVTVSHKIVLPMSGTLIDGLRTPLAPLGPALSSTIAGTTVLLLPGAFGFMVWELRGNWGLYRQNRARWLEPVHVGHHGETMAGLLRPGFHSGTVPKLHAKLRRAAAKGSPAAAKHREELRHVEGAVRTFVERELLALLDESGRWTAGQVRVGEVSAGSNRIRVELCCPAASPEPAWLHFEEQSGLLLASVARPGWFLALPASQRAVLEAALAGLYRMASVDLSREQLEACLPPGTPYDISDEGLVVWPGDGYRSEVVYTLDPSRGGELAATARGEPLAHPPPKLHADAVLLARQRIGWDAWSEHWAGEPPAGRARPGLAGRAILGSYSNSIHDSDLEQRAARRVGPDQGEAADEA
jgi:hypothetical protein